ncbi:MAG: 50S ribosomal protein L3 [Phycisphaerales bacterium]|nr:50S ribosomal protein L3 [Phycisphaerales bacterium]
MAVELLGRKIGMTRYFLEDGCNVPVTVLEVGPCYVTQIKTTETDKYAAVQIGYDEIKPRRSTMQMIGHDAKAGAAPQRFHREFHVGSDEEAKAFTLGQVLTVKDLEGVKFVDVVGRSKGKGFAGVVKRYHFAGQEASHGVERKHRSGGSIGGGGTNRGTGPKPKKGKRMAGHMGDERVTVRSIDVVGVDEERNLIFVKGPVPGPNRGFVTVRPAIRLYRRKAKLQAAG